MVHAVEFDFATKQERSIPIEEAAGACARGNSAGSTSTSTSLKDPGAAAEVAA